MIHGVSKYPKTMGHLALTLKSSDMGWAVRVSFFLTTSGVDLEPTPFPSDHTDFVREAEVTGASNQLPVCV